MLDFIKLEGFALLSLAIYILHLSMKPEKGLWRINSSRVDKIKG